MKKQIFALIIGFFFIEVCANASKEIPLPEHPRPDFERTEWMNLNGTWAFTFNKQIAENAINQNEVKNFDLQIQVPFGWGSKLSGVPNNGDEGWYARNVTIPEAWKGKRIYLVIGASEWDTKVWFEGKYLGNHQGGYTPFEFEVTSLVKNGMSQNLFIKANDAKSDKRLDGKQGYGDVRGIWQTVYLEARGENYVDYVHFSPDIDRSVVKVEMALNKKAGKGSSIRLHFKNKEQADFIYTLKKESSLLQFEVKLTNQKLWSLEDPHLYNMEISLQRGKQNLDRVNTYFGQRKISTILLPGTDYPYVALNNKPVYLQLCLDQSYHPDGYYTFPTDKFMRDEILLSKRLGLSGNRIHIKAEVPRKLYWADKLGLLIMTDVPNFWGEPGEDARKDWKYSRDNQVKRDYNHPSIFAWVNFNETWGLFTRKDKKKSYLPETQEWVRQMYLETKKLDPTRLVEDNSACNEDHVQTDLNTWHQYSPNYKWKEVLDKNVKETYPGSTWNFINGNKQTSAPMLNSECGNVWGYNGSTGDVDFTWDYHIMMNEFRSHPKCAGWLYTEHHDVINEWNGYVRFDRSPKIDGLNDLVPDMSLADLHSPFYIVPQVPLCQEVKSGSQVVVPLFASFMTDKDPGTLSLETNLIGWDVLGNKSSVRRGSYEVAFKPFMDEMIKSAVVNMPSESGLYVLQFELKDLAGQVVGRNFTAFRIKDGVQPASKKEMRLQTFDPKSFVASKWSLKQWNVFDGLKVNGAGSGYFEYSVPWPEGNSLKDLESVSLVFEASAKQLFGKDNQGAKDRINGDFMRGGGTFDPCKNPNSYAMTDQTTFPSYVTVSVNGHSVGGSYLPDDPADHRGILSWYAQLQDKTLHEAGSYGYLVRVNIPISYLEEGQPILLRLEVPEGTNGGLAIYGKDFGRYPLDPTLVFIKK